MDLSALDDERFCKAIPAESLLLCVEPSITSLSAIANLAASPARTLISMECCAPSLVLNVNTVVWNSVYDLPPCCDASMPFISSLRFTLSVCIDHWTA